MRADTRTVDLSERRHDLRHDVPVPFASDRHAGYGVDHRQEPTGPADLGAVVKARAIQCALSRVCSLCGLSMSGPTTFVGSPQEGEANTFGFPPMHVDCAEFALATYPQLRVPVLGQELVHDDWTVVYDRWLRPRAAHRARGTRAVPPELGHRDGDRHHRVSERGSARWSSFAGLRSR